MKKKYIFVFTIPVLFASLVSFASAAPGQVSGGLVPKSCQSGICTLCDLYTLGENIVNFILFNLITPVAVIALIVGGVMLIASGGSEERQSTGKRIIRGVALGMLIAFTAWLIINTLVVAIGFKIPFSQAIKWWQNPCPETTSQDSRPATLGLNISVPAHADAGQTITVYWTATGPGASSAQCQIKPSYDPATLNVSASGSRDFVIPGSAASGSIIEFNVSCITSNPETALSKEIITVRIN